MPDTDKADSIDPKKLAHAKKVDVLHSGLIANANGLQAATRQYEALLADPNMQKDRSAVLAELLRLNELFLEISEHVTGAGIAREKLAAQKEKPKMGTGTGNGNRSIAGNEAARMRPAFAPKMRTKRSSQNPPPHIPNQA